MTRPITLFTGQWADLPFEEVASLAAGWGYDGLEIACWGDHLDVRRAADDLDYCVGRRELLGAHGLDVWAISNHLVGQAVCDPIDERHRAILPRHVWGDGDPDGVPVTPVDTGAHGRVRFLTREADAEPVVAAILDAVAQIRTRPGH